jgi:hypothetical protein
MYGMYAEQLGTRSNPNNSVQVLRKKKRLFRKKKNKKNKIRVLVPEAGQSGCQGHRHFGAIWLVPAIL